MISTAHHIVIPGRAQREPGISRFRVWSCEPSRNDDWNYDPAFSALSISTFSTVSIFSGVTGPTIL